MMATDDRFEHEGAKLTREERDDYQAKLDSVDDAKDVFLLEVAAAARKYGQALYAADPQFVILFNSHSRQQERGPEAIQGFVEYVQAISSDLASELKDHEEIARVTQLAETGHD